MQKLPTKACVRVVLVKERRRRRRRKDEEWEVEEEESYLSVPFHRGCDGGLLFTAGWLGACFHWFALCCFGCDH